MFRWQWQHKREPSKAFSNPLSSAWKTNWSKISFTIQLMFFGQLLCVLRVKAKTVYSVFFLGTTWSLIPFGGDKNALLVFKTGGISVSLHVSNLNSCSILTSANLISIKARRKPMQLLGPSPKGNQETGWMLARFSLKNLSGRNSSGSSQISGSWWMA